MYQLTGKGRGVADALDRDPDKEYLFPHLADWDLSQVQQICLNWLRGDLGPKLMDIAIQEKVVHPTVPRSLDQLVKKGFVEVIL